MYEVRLGLQALLRNRKRTITTSAIVSLFMVFMILLNAIIYTDFATRDLHREMIFGSWSHAFYESNDSIPFEKVGTYHRITDSLGSFDENMFELSNFEYYSGHQPKNETEIIITIDEIQSRNLTYELNQMITIDGSDYKLVGIIFSYNNDWVRREDFKFPSIITINMKSEDTILFGKANNLNRLYEPEDYLLVNTFAHPFIDQEGPAADDRFKETLLMDQQSLILTQFMLVVAISVLFIVFKNSAKFYQKRLTIFKQQGMSFIGILKYLLAQIIVLILLVPIIFSLVPQLLEWIVQSFGNNRYDNNLFNLGYAGKSLILSLPILFFISFVSIETRQKGGSGYRVIQFLMVAVIMYATLFLTIPTTIDLIENRFPEWMTYDEIRELSMTYNVSGSRSAFLGFKESEWTSEELNVIREHPQTKTLVYWNHHPVNQGAGESTVTADVYYYDNNFIKSFVSSFHATEDFEQGNSFYYKGDLQEGEIQERYQIGEVVYFNGVPFYYEKHFSNDQSPFGDIGASFEILISEEGARKIGLPTDTYSDFRVQSESVHDFLEYDALIQRVSKGSFFENKRLGVERLHKQLRGITFFMVLEVILQYSLGIAILVLLYLQKLMIERQSMAVHIFLGESKLKMVLKKSISFVLPAVIPLVLLLFTTQAEWGILLWNFILGLVFMVILWIVCALIHYYYLKNNTFELLNERE